MLAYGLGTNSMILEGFAVSYGEIVIVIPDEIPESYPAPSTPLTLYQENTYNGIALYLDQEWADFLAQIQAEIFFTAKRRNYDVFPLFSVNGVLDQAGAKITFDLTSSDTAGAVDEEYRWEIMAHRLAPDFFRVIIKGRLSVQPILRRIT